MSYESSPRKRKDVDLTTEARPKRRRAQYLTVMYADEGNATELSEVPLIEDIPEIVAEEEDGGNDRTQGDSDGNASHSSDTEPGDTSDDELEVDQVYLTGDDLSTVVNAIPAPIVAAEGLVLDEYLEDGDRSFYYCAEDDGNESDDEGEQQEEAETEKEGEKEDKAEDDGSWRAFDEIIRKPFKNDEFMLEDSRHSLVSCRVNAARTGDVGLHRRKWVYEYMDRAWLCKDEVCAAEHEWARQYMGDLPEEFWSCRHINPDQPRIPVKIPEPKTRGRARVIARASTAPRSPTPVPVPAPLTIEISDAFTEDGQPVVEEPTFALDPALLSSGAGGGVSGPLTTAEDVAVAEILLALSASGDKSREMKKVGVPEDVDDYPEIPNEADDDTRSGRASPDQPRRDVVDRPHEYFWGADEPLLLESLFPAVCLPM